MQIQALSHSRHEFGALQPEGPGKSIKYFFFGWAAHSRPSHLILSTARDPHRPENMEAQPDITQDSVEPPQDNDSESVHSQSEYSMAEEDFLQLCNELSPLDKDFDEKAEEVHQFFEKSVSFHS